MAAALHSLPTVIGSEWTASQTQFSAHHLQNQIVDAHTKFSFHTCPYSNASVDRAIG